MDIRIRPAVSADQATIVDFNARLAEETEERQLDLNVVRPGVEALLADTQKGQYWIASIADEVAGQLMVTYEWSDWRNGVFWWIQSVYVPAPFRRCGVFTALYRHVETLARADESACGIRLYVEKENVRAQQTYENLNMKLPGYLIMESSLLNDAETQNA